jgi:hypothetical protein
VQRDEVRPEARGVEGDLIECELRDERGDVKSVWVPRIRLMPKDEQYTYEWMRTQFPVRPAFAMTVNKSQGLRG